MKTKASFISPAMNGSGHLLALAALFDGSFSIDWIVDLSGEKPSQVLSVLEEGARSGCLTRNEIGIYSFSDLEEQKKWQDHLATKEKEKLNKRIADFLIKTLPDNSNKAQRIATQLLPISNDLENCRWLAKAGDEYLTCFQAEKALQCYTKILDDLSDVQEEEIDSLFTEVTIKYSKISMARHDTKKVLSILNEAIVRAKRWENKKSQALLEMHLAKNQWLCSSYPEALRHFEKGWAIAKELNDSRVLRSATTFSTFFLFWQGYFREVIRTYEKAVTDVDKLPSGKFPLLATIVVGLCYAHIGQRTQGLGMLDTIQTYCQERGDKNLACYARVAIGDIMLKINRVKDAIEYLEFAIEDATRVHNDWAKIMGWLMLANAYFLRGESKRSISYLRDFLKSSNKVHVTVQCFPYLMDLFWGIEQGKLPPLKGQSLEREVRRMIKNDNVFMKGVAYRYHALLQRQNNIPHEKVIDSLNLSLRCLGDAGAQVEIIKSQLELAREYSSYDDEKRAKQIVMAASKALSSMGKLGEELVPDDLKYLVSERLHGETLLKRILNLGKEVVTIRDNKQLVQHIISTLNQITGAERGAILVSEGGTSSPTPVIRASKNLAPEQITHPSFAASMEMIKEVALTGKGRISETSLAQNTDFDSTDSIRSSMCVPMILRDKVVGVLYHDNRLLRNAFRESDLELLAYFAALAAFAMDNAQAYEEIQNLNQKLGEEKQYYEEQHLRSLRFDEIVGRSAAIKRVFAQIDKVATTDTTILILGETGVGKGLVAKAIHNRSKRRDEPFIQVNCNELPESLIQSELFGHEKGAFTGAIKRRIGRFELADGGTLFLDEIGDLPLELQVRLLNVLQDKEFRRVGGNEIIQCDFRLIAATNRDLEQDVEANRFRSDLYYRLNVFPVDVPPLRDRKEDITHLLQHFLKIYSKKMGKSFPKIPESEIGKLIQYEWPGNVRELENIIERGVILCSGDHFSVPDFSGAGHYDSVQSKPDISLKEAERRHIMLALQKAGWKVRGPGGTAELLDIHPSTLLSRMKKLGINRPKRIPG